MRRTAAVLLSAVLVCALALLWDHGGHWEGVDNPAGGARG